MNENNLDYNFNKCIGEVMKELRLSKGYSLEDVSVKLQKEITKQSLNYYENGSSRMKHDIYKKLCAIYNVSEATTWDRILNRFYEYNNSKEEKNVELDSSHKVDKIIMDNLKELTEEEKQKIIGIMEILKSNSN